MYLPNIVAKINKVSIHAFITACTDYNWHSHTLQMKFTIHCDLQLSQHCCLHVSSHWYCPTANTNLRLFFDGYFICWVPPPLETVYSVLGRSSLGTRPKASPPLIHFKVPCIHSTGHLECNARHAFMLVYLSSEHTLWKVSRCTCRIV